MYDPIIAYIWAYLCVWDRRHPRNRYLWQKRLQKKKSRTMQETKRTREKCCGSGAAYGTAGDGTHWAQLEKLLVLAFDVITVGLTERQTPSGEV